MTMVSLRLAQGEMLALLGENGAGKTTLMNILFGHYAADAGEVRVFGRTLPPGRPRAAIEAVWAWSISTSLWPAISMCWTM